MSLGKGRWFVGLILVPALISAGVWLAVDRSSSAAPSGQALAEGYVGSLACRRCHPSQYSGWKVSGHPYVLLDSEGAQEYRELPLPDGYSWDGISYTVGGYKWKVRYLNRSGYFITTTAQGPGKNQYNRASASPNRQEALNQLTAPTLTIETPARALEGPGRCASPGPVT